MSKLDSVYSNIMVASADLVRFRAKFQSHPLQLQVRANGKIPIMLSPRNRWSGRPRDLRVSVFQMTLTDDRELLVGRDIARLDKRIFY